MLYCKRPFEVVVFEGAGHSGNLGRARSHCPCGVAPFRGHGRNLFDDRASLGERECEILRRLFEDYKKIQGAQQTESRSCR